MTTLVDKRIQELESLVGDESHKVNGYLIIDRYNESKRRDGILDLQRHFLAKRSKGRQL